MTPRSARLAAATQMLPGPATMTTGRQSQPAVGVPDAVAQGGGHGPGAADRVHLVDAEQCGGGQDGRVRPAVVARLWARRWRSQPTPASWAATTFITTELGVDGAAAGTQRPTRTTGIQRSTTREPSPSTVVCSSRHRGGPAGPAGWISSAAPDAGVQAVEGRGEHLGLER